MTSTPYPSFRNFAPAHESRGLALTAVGRCRIHPSSDQISSVVEACRQQVSVDDDNNNNETYPTEDSKKKARKKFMKQAVALAQSYLQRISLTSSVISMVQIEVVLDATIVLETKGCLASCFLDAGCQTIVLDGRNLEALEALHFLPLDRICGNFVYAPTGLFEAIDACQAHCSAVSIELTSQDATESTMLSLMESILPVTSSSSHTHVLSVAVHVPGDVVSARAVASVCQLGSKRGGGTVALVDPTAKQLGTAYAACLKTDRDDGLYTTVVCTRSGEALGLVYSSKESIVAALESGRGVYYSRSRRGLWRKGDTSGHVQQLHGVHVDCDGDALRFTVTQLSGDNTPPAFCHLNTYTCWGMPRGLRLLEETLQDRLKNAPEGSYTKRLFEDSKLLNDKLVEEAQELSEADDKQHIAEELADLLYFAMVRAAKAGVSIDDAVVELDKRARKVTRRQGDSKDFRIAAGKEILDKKKEELGD